MNLWFANAALLALALILVILPARDAIRQAGAQARGGLAFLALIPIVGVALYMHLGAPAIVEEQALTQAQANYDADGLVKALEKKIKSAPTDVEGLYTLGRSYIATGRHAEAEKVLAKAAELAPKDARILAQYAEAVAMKSGSLLGRPQEIINAALEIDYEDEKALELAGLAAFQQEKWAESLHFWRRLMKKLPPETDSHEAVRQGVKIAEEKVAVASGLGEKAKLVAPEPVKNPH